MRGWLYRRRVRRLVAIYGADTARWHHFVDALERARTRAVDTRAVNG